MADEQTHPDGEIISVSAEGSAVRVESWLNGEPHVHVFDREGYADKDGTYHPPGNEPPALPDLKSPDRYEGEILSAYVNENGDIHVERFVDGEVSSYIHSEEPVMRADDPPHTAPDGSPIPTEVIHVREDGVVVAREPDGEGGTRTHYYDTEPVAYPTPPTPTEIAITPTNELDAWVHNAAREAEPIHNATPVEDVAPTEVMSIRTEPSGHQVEVWHLDDGRTRTVDYEPVFQAPPPVPTAVDLDAVPDGVHSAAVDGSSIHDAAHDTSGTAHADANAPSHGTDAPTDDSSHATAAAGD